MNIKPLADRVLVVPAPAEEKTIGGIIIPDTAKEKPLKTKRCSSRWATPSSTASMPAPSWKSKAPSISSCVKATFSRL